jgi:outer membrane usher protein
VVIAPLGSLALLSVHYRPGVPPREVMLRRGRDGVWRVPLAEWQRWTRRAPQRLETEDDGTRWVALEPGLELAVRLDACTSELWVDPEPHRLQSVELTHPYAPPPVSRAGYGGFLNLDAAYGGYGGSAYYSSVFDLGAFVPGGAGRSGFFIDRHGGRRLDSDWLVDDVENAQRLRLGDAITHSADWESAVRFGGVQWGTDFSLQPDRVTFPLPILTGAAALPSTAQLYLNGQRLAQQPLQPGQFQFIGVPVITGAGELALTLRDALGRLQTVTQPFYASPRLLVRGLDAYTFEAGFLRENYAAADDRYTQPLASVFFQHGFSDAFTGLVRTAATRQRQLFGTQADVLLGTFGVATVTTAAAHTEAGWGGMATLAFERIAEPFTLAVRRQIASRSYGDLGRAPGALHFSDTLRLSYDTGRVGIGSLLYVSEQPWDGAGARLAGLAYNVQAWPGIQAYASWLHPLNRLGSDSLVLGLAFALGPGNSASAQWTHDDQGGGPRASVQHTPLGPLGWSWFAGSDQRPGGSRQAQVQWATERGTLSGGWVGFAGHGAAAAGIQTGLALLDGHPYWTRPVQNSFAVVDAGAPGVPVFRENQPVGVTGEDGRLLVPDLIAYNPNRLSIDDRDLPIRYRVDETTVSLVPPAGAGVPLRFSVETTPELRLHLLDAHGRPVPVGAQLALDGQPLPLPVGYDGLVYAKIGAGWHRLDAHWAGGACTARLRVTGATTMLGPCR